MSSAAMSVSTIDDFDGHLQSRILCSVHFHTTSCMSCSLVCSAEIFRNVALITVSKSLLDKYRRIFAMNSVHAEDDRLMEAQHVGVQCSLFCISSFPGSSSFPGKFCIHETF